MGTQKDTMVSSVGWRADECCRFSSGMTLLSRFYKGHCCMVFFPHVLIVCPSSLKAVQTSMWPVERGTTQSVEGNNVVAASG